MADLGVYVHVPFCVRKCPYCDFLSFPVDNDDSFEEFSGMLEQDYLQGVLSEIRRSSLMPEWQGRRLASLYFGGGTPSLLPSASIAAMAAEIKHRFEPLENCEISLEANPGTILGRSGKNKLRDYLAAGVNRISLGIQSLNDDSLSRLGRIHSAAQAIEAADNIKAAGFSNWSADLLFGLSGENPGAWRNNLERVLELRPRHLSVYALTVDGPSQYRRRIETGERLLAEEQDYLAIYECTEELLRKEGLLRYEISNYAHEGFACRHNLRYWERKDYLGLGLGAHSFVSSFPDSRDEPSVNSVSNWGIRRANTTSLESYLQAITRDEACIESFEELTREQAELEFVILGLRRVSGIDTNRFEDCFGTCFEERFQGLLAELERDELIIREDFSLRLTPRGLLVSDSVFSRFAEILC